MNKDEKKNVRRGIYYAIVIIAYLLFEVFPINYRPILINGFMEASYPSSTTLLVTSVMPTLVWQIDRRVKTDCIKKAVRAFSIIFTLFMVLGRLVAGVHWLTDIIGSIVWSFFILLLITVLNGICGTFISQFDKAICWNFLFCNAGN